MRRKQPCLYARASAAATALMVLCLLLANCGARKNQGPPSSWMQEGAERMDRE